MSDSHSSDGATGAEGVGGEASAPGQTTATPAASAGKPGAAGQPVPKKWYIVHTYSGQEARAKQSLLERATALGFEEKFDEILIPEESVVEMVKGQKRNMKRKFFPGYIIVCMELNDETWHVVKGTPKVTGFVGGATNPPPISEEEVAQMTQRMKDGEEKPKPTITFEEGESVRVIDGPFANFSGYVDEVMPEKEKLRVMVQVFGRATPVVLDYTNVELA
ncbi:MAG: transcription termination/antitermination protein NusG [Myxococcota bacterium]|nr:transcription termination/antitermination protein NusG [Myxococcota bacterium]